MLARPDLLEAMTHGPRGDIISVYTSFPWGAAQSVAAFAIVVDAKDDAAIAFYRTFGFAQFPSTPDRLFLLAQTAAAGLELARK